MKKSIKLIIVLIIVTMNIVSIEPIIYARYAPGVSHGIDLRKQDESVIKNLELMGKVQTVVSFSALILLFVGIVQFTKFQKLGQMEQTDISEDEIERGKRAGLSKIKVAILILRRM